MTARFVLEKRPNLLSCSLILPLVDENASEEEATKIAAKLGSSQRIGPLPPTSKRTSVVAPSMSIERKADGTSMVRVFAPFRESLVATEYASVPVDCKLDVDRSALTLHGDHLAARLAFTEYCSARDARDERESSFPEAVELQAQLYYENGINCRNCGSNLVAPQIVRSAHRAPKLPWGELIECLTCVRPEDYLASETVDEAFKCPSRRISPRPGSVFVAEAHICISGKDFDVAHTLREYAPGQPPLLLNESEQQAKIENWSILSCAGCDEWLGDARREEGLLNLIEVRLFKCAIRTSNLFNKYHVDSLLCGSVIDAASTRECFRFVLGHTSPDGTVRALMKLVLLSYDSWFSTNQNLKLRPALKFLFWNCGDGNGDSIDTAHWARRTGAEWIVLPSKRASETIASALASSNKLFPHSMRCLADGSKVGFLFW